jgi:hypothetical protein
MKVLLLFALAAAAAAADGLSGFPFTSEELRYTVNWPSGLSLGEGVFRANKTADGWEFEFHLAASIPAYAVSERHRAVASADLCSVSLRKESTRGARKTREETQFDASAARAVRKTDNGGKTEFAIAACARDALTFLYFTRRELGQGRVPPQQPIYFGAEYRIRLVYTGAETVSIAGRRSVTDRIQASVKGPKSDSTFEMYFARDAARTPLLIRVPLAAGSFSLELTR